MGHLVRKAALVGLMSGCRTRGTIVALAFVALLAVGCSPTPSESGDDSAPRTLSTPTTEAAYGSRERPRPLWCGTDHVQPLQDAWYNAASMPRTCLTFELQSQTTSGECVFGVPSQQSDLEAIQRVIHSWTKGITLRNVGSEALWGQVAIHFQHCELFSQAKSLRVGKQRAQARQRCNELRDAVDKAWQRYVDHSSYESYTEDERLRQQHRRALDAWERSRCA